jgi:carboxypeptidase Q
MRTLLAGSCALVIAVATSACDETKAVTTDAGAPAVASAAPAASLALPSVDAGSYAPTTAEVALAQRLAGSIVVGGHSMDYERELADGIGARLTGSEAYRRAAAWAADAFRKAGIEHVAIEPFTIATTWERRPVVASIVAPVTVELHAIASAWAVPTSAAGLRGDVVKIKDASPAAIAKMGDAELRGKIALIDRGTYDSVKKKLDMMVALDALKPRGVIGVLSAGTRDNDVPGAGSAAHPDTMTASFSAIRIGKEDAARIERLLEKGNVTVSFVDESPTGAPAQVPNVIAEIRGRDLPDEWVLLGAHLDSWDLATGAQDNGTGSEEVLEAARAIAALGAPPRRSIRFALWGGEEEGLLGSRAYAAAHAAELDRAAYVLNTDHGTGAPKGWELDRQSAIDPMHALALALLPGLGGDKLESKMTCSTDHCPFMLLGVPTANLLVDDSKYDDIHHTPGDTLEKVSPASLAQAAAIVAVTAYAIADAPARLAPRLDHAAVGASLKKADELDVLVSGGYWKR